MHKDEYHHLVSSNVTRRKKKKIIIVMRYKLGRQYSTTNAVTFPGIIEVQRERRFIKEKGKLLQYFKQGYFNK